jgi:Na+/H+ antiporter NhaD/arsenite permease-like protein
MPPTVVHTPSWAVVPFVAYLLAIAILPLVAARFWEHNRNKLLLGLAAGAPVVLYLLSADRGELLLETVREYLAFMALLSALFVISGGIWLKGSLAGTPAVNTAVLAVGSVLSSLIGTTGASALLIRPLLRANEKRARRRHIIIFFIFIVANGGGLLTPLGDPPLFLGFLRGVPFSWTLRLVQPWLVVNGALLLIFALFDRAVLRREKTLPAAGDEPLRVGESSAARRGADASPWRAAGPIRIEGGLNFLWLLGVVGLVFWAGTYGFASPGARAAAQVAGLVALAALSLKTTPRHVHEANRFSWAPVQEVAVVFIGVFVTMVPALSFLAERGASLGITRPWQFFWASGALSSVLDNAPTYLTFASLASGVAHAGDLGALAAHPSGAQLLAAVSCGSVMMGAVTYIGNGPNFMVKAIAEQHHVRMPGFFGYTLWSFAILVPIFGAVALLFF